MAPSTLSFQASKGKSLVFFQRSPWQDLTQREKQAIMSFGFVEGLLLVTRVCVRQKSVASTVRVCPRAFLAMGHGFEQREAHFHGPDYF